MDNIKLVEYDKTYFDLSKEWLSDGDLNHLIHAGELPSDEERLTWFESLSKRRDYLIWGVEYSNLPIGVSGLKRIENRQAEYWGYIGEKAFWGKGIGKVLMKEVINKAIALGLETIWLRVRKYNMRAINLYKKTGFVIDIDETETYHMTMSIQKNS